MFRFALAVVALMFASPSQAQNLTTDELNQRHIYRRAVEAMIWGMPAVNYHLMYLAAVRSKGNFNQMIYWSRLQDWKNQTLTPNPDVIYLMPFINTKDVGPVVLEIPPADGGAINGSIMNYWQAAIEDVGPAGVDKGKGGKYLLLPPGYPRDKVPTGYIPMQSDTFRGFALLRSILQSGSDADVAKAVDYAKRIKLYPLSQAANPPATAFVDVADIVYDATIPYDVRFFQLLNEIVQTEPWLERDRAMIDQLRTIGIEHGKPFSPDRRTEDILNSAAEEAHAWLEAQYEAGITPYFSGGRWGLPAQPEFLKAVETFFQQPDSYPVDARGLAYTYAFFSARHLGQGQFYLMTLRDKVGNALEGRNTYRLTVPPDAPVSQYWSATLYNRDTHALIRDVSRTGRGSQSPGLQKNSDGSIDLFFGPKPPPGKESNWAPTDPNGRFEVLFRLYGPQKPLFDKTWVLPDIEKVD